MCKTLFKDGALYKNQRVLIIGGAYSAEDICMLCYKNEAKISHVSSRKPTGFHYDWPEAIVDKILSEKTCRKSRKSKVEKFTSFCSPINLP